MRISDVSSDVFSSDLGIFLFVFAIMLLAMQLHRLQQRRVGAFQALADEQALRAAERELMIGEMAHRMKNAFARIGALARITLRESTSLEDFEASFAGPIAALPDAKPILARGAGPEQRWVGDGGVGRGE